MSALKALLWPADVASKAMIMLLKFARYGNKISDGCTAGLAVRTLYCVQDSQVLLDRPCKTQPCTDVNNCSSNRKVFVATANV